MAWLECSGSLALDPYSLACDAVVSFCADKPV